MAWSPHKKSHTLGIAFFPAIGAFGSINLSSPSTEDPKCAQIRADIAKKLNRIEQLNNEDALLDPKIPFDRDKIKRDSAEIGGLEKEIAALEQQAATLGCK
jgi:hypothetical protein